MPSHENIKPKTEAILAGLIDDKSCDETLEELALLSETAGAKVLAKVTQKRASKDPAYYLGMGKAREIAELVEGLGANAVIFDDDLTPVQIRNLENLIGVQIIDRTTLVLDIFAQRARSLEGKIQVELAQLQHMLPRLTGKGVELSREGGGIGTRGPGETKLETDRRHIRRRITHLKKELERIRKNRKLLRSSRKYPVISLVGYTNAGKSTLMNALTGAGVSSNDRLFDTLDPTTRALLLPDGRRVLLSDTVGFIRKLPHEIVEAFKATLEEVKEADLLIHVVDASSPKADEEISTVKSVLKEIGAENIPTILALNKIDRVNHRELITGEENVVEISALCGTNLDILREKICQLLPQTREHALLCIPYEYGFLLDEIHETSLVEREEFKQDGIEIEGKIDTILLRRIKKYLSEKNACS
ncbi:GTPase HflX [Thermosediminibacter oceani]|uniref:GTPase HflX n=1 Tax=Thermosediminibacter oceani (strain ATCC BAA-1034 / DSM 16646 / JW/IW-1228P) TaxID=555079 RepID=D9RYW8_THEOJ|nr:GTPase HflX [Thermosediminibacter oceani]ADL08542.1 GTP-binding proten HflX [Thermosediminibacter oceani DSM 16646]